MELKASFYNSKVLYYNFPCGFRCYFHEDILARGRDIDDHLRGKFLYREVYFPINDCDIIEIDDTLLIVPGNYNLFLFSCDGEIKEIDNSIKVFKSGDGDCALILSERDNIKIKWSDGDYQWITILYKDRDKLSEEIASEEILKYL